LWQEALTETGVDPAEYLRRRYLDEVLPWDHLSCGVDKQFLQRELAHAVEGRLTPDCSIERCTYCGARDFTAVKNATYHASGAKGSEHGGAVIDNWAQVTVDGGDEPGSWEPRGWHKVRAKRAAPVAGVGPPGAERRAAPRPDAPRPAGGRTPVARPGLGN